MRSGNELGWHPRDIPDVIAAAANAGLLNIGGQLQFLLPNGTCESYWVEVDTSRSVSPMLPWEQRVQLAAATATTSFARLTNECDFVSEGRRAFSTYLDEFEQGGGDVDSVLCFVWYLQANGAVATMEEPA